MDAEGHTARGPAGHAECPVETFSLLVFASAAQTGGQVFHERQLFATLGKV